MRFLAAPAMVLTLSACTTAPTVDPDVLLVDVSCNPFGASLYQANTKTLLGYCPTTLVYRLRDKDRASGVAMLNGIQAIWVSGASAAVDRSTFQLSHGLHQAIAFDRPRDAPHYDIDANYALEIEKNHIQQQQARQAEVQATIDQFGNAVAAANAAYTNPPPRTSVNCTTNRIGNTSYTNCF